MSSARSGVIKTVTHDKITTTANPIVSTRDIVGSLHPQLFPLSRVCKPPLEILVRWDVVDPRSRMAISYR